jgi:hypothetical protein
MRRPQLKREIAEEKKRRPQFVDWATAFAEIAQVTRPVKSSDTLYLPAPWQEEPRLSELAREIAKLRFTVLRDTFREVRAHRDPNVAAPVLALIAPCLPLPQKAFAVDDALNRIPQIAQTGIASLAVETLARSIFPEHRQSCIEVASSIKNDADRACALVSLSQSRNKIDATLRAILEVQDPVSRVDVFNRLFAELYPWHQIDILRLASPQLEIAGSLYGIERTTIVAPDLVASVRPEWFEKTVDRLLLLPEEARLEFLGSLSSGRRVRAFAFVENLINSLSPGYPQSFFRGTLSVIRHAKRQLATSPPRDWAASQKRIREKLKGREKWLDAKATDPSLTAIRHLRITYPDRQHWMLRSDLKRSSFDPPFHKALRDYENKTGLVWPDYEPLSYEAAPAGHESDISSKSAKYRQSLSEADALPDKPPRMWEARHSGRPAKGNDSDAELIAFIREVYGPYFSKHRNRLRAYIYGNDQTLYRKIYRFEAKGGKLPKDIGMPSQRVNADSRRMKEAALAAARRAWVFTLEIPDSDGEMHDLNRFAPARITGSGPLKRDRTPSRKRGRPPLKRGRPPLKRDPSPG